MALVKRKEKLLTDAHEALARADTAIKAGKEMSMCLVVHVFAHGCSRGRHSRAHRGSSHASSSAEHRQKMVAGRHAWLIALEVKVRHIR